MRYDIIPIQQKDHECAPACLAMALNAFGIPIDQEKIIAKIPKNTPKWREWLYWIGSVALDYVSKAEVFSMSTQVLDPSWSGLNSHDLAVQLNKELRFIQKILSSGKEPYQDYFIEHYIELEKWEIKASLDFLKKRGIIRIVPTTIEAVRMKLDNGYIAIASVDAAILYSAPRGIPKSDPVKGSTWGHVVLVGGCYNDDFTIFDPADLHAKKQKFNVPSGRLIESILRRDQNILFVKK